MERSLSSPANRMEQSGARPTVQRAGARKQKRRFLCGPVSTVIITVARIVLPLWAIVFPLARLIAGERASERGVIALEGKDRTRARQRSLRFKSRLADVEAQALAGIALGSGHEAALPLRFREPTAQSNARGYSDLRYSTRSLPSEAVSFRLKNVL